MYGEGNTGLIQSRYYGNWLMQYNCDEGDNCTGIRHNDNWLIQYYTYTGITIIIASLRYHGGDLH